MEELEPIIVVKKFDHFVEASLAKSKLESEDIPCFLTEEHLTQLYTPLLSGGIRLHIFKKDEEKVLKILSNTLFLSED